MAKRKIKKYNPLKHEQLNPEKVVENTGIYQLPNNKCEFINTATGDFILNSNKNTVGGVSKSRRLSMVYTQAKFNWTVALLVFTITPKGEKALKVTHVAPPFACKADLIADSIKEQHEKMYNKVNPKEFIAAGWLAIPREEYLSNVTLFNIFDKAKVWDTYITQVEDGYKLKE